MIDNHTRDHWAMLAADAPDIITLRQRRVKARKFHDCSWCEHPIAIGEYYGYSFVLDDDRKPISTHVCWRCMIGGVS